MTAHTPLKVGIDARLVSGTKGGVESFVIGLAHGLSRLSDRTGDEYVFLTYEGHDAWLRPHLGGPCKAISISAPRSWSRTVLDLLPGSGSTRTAVRRRIAAALPRRFEVPASNGVFESVGCSVIHFPMQWGFLTDLPSVYHPHDLQHLHMPQFFGRQEYRNRELLYRTLCADASLVAVASNWTREDVMSAYGLPANKVAVVPLAPPVDALPVPHRGEVQASLASYYLPSRYILYPAATWPHKNHCRLIDAVSQLNAAGLNVDLVCTGMKTSYYPTIERHLSRLGLERQVRFLGFVPAVHLAALYSQATAVVVPSQFEAASFPIWEAFRLGTPVACSNVTSLPEQVGDAALVFDPENVESMAASIGKLWTEPESRARLVSAGQERIRGYSWVQTAREFREHYRRLVSTS